MTMKDGKTYKKHHFPAQANGTASRWPHSGSHPAHIALIHVGKTAGASVKVMLDRAHVPHHQVHTQNAHTALDCRFTHYIVTTRDPINRTISAFNWRHTNGGRENIHTHSPAEMELYNECFPQVSGASYAFAEALSSSGRCAMLARACLFEPARGCEHLAKGHAYYLQSTGLIERLRQPEVNLFVVRLEHLEEDMAALLDWLCIPADKHLLIPKRHTSYARQSDTALSNLGLQTLRSSLMLEYHTLEALQAIASSKLEGGGAACEGCPPPDPENDSCYRVCFNTGIK